MASTSSVYVAGRCITLSPRSAIAAGGEGEVYSIGGGLALKLYKSPDHPDLQSPDPTERAALRAAARERLDIAQRKLPSFPRDLPPAVLGPLEIAYDGRDRGARVIGYTMTYLAGADLLYSYGKRKFRDEALKQGLTPAKVLDVLRDLHSLVRAVHAKGVVIGDFNDLNVLAKDGRAYLVDADSFQFGGYGCLTFQDRFVDPLLCEPGLDHLEPCRPHTARSDWYAYAVMVMQSLLYAHPYAGIYKGAGKAGESKLSEAARPVHRITVFSPGVHYPRPAIHYRALPDELVEYLRETFERDRREEFPRALLERLCWTTCPRCGAEHARQDCPWCAPQAVGVPAPPLTTIRTEILQGGVTATLVFHTDGRIVATLIDDGRITWLYEQGEELRGEDETILLRGTLNPGTRVRLSQGGAHIGYGGHLVTLRPGMAPERRTVDMVKGAWAGKAAGADGIPAFDANSSHLYWVESGRLYRDSALGPFGMGDVLSHATRIWAGEKFGFGYYRSGGLEGGLLFDAERAGINDRVEMGLPPGRLLDATCAFGVDRCWFLASIEGARAVTNHCVLVSRDGRVLARHATSEGDGSWLGVLGGKCAGGATLLCPTDAGVARVEEAGGALVQTDVFPGTAPYVDSATRLLAGKDGLYTVTAKTIHMLRLASSPIPSGPVVPST